MTKNGRLLFSESKQKQGSESPVFIVIILRRIPVHVVISSDIFRIQNAFQHVCLHLLFIQIRSNLVKFLHCLFRRFRFGFIERLLRTLTLSLTFLQIIGKP